jgi:restriction system protein
MGRRGFFAELQHQARVAERERERQARESYRRQVEAERAAERARKDNQRLQTQYARAKEADRKRLEKEQRDAHFAAKEAEAAQKNEELGEIYEELDSLLASTLAVDDYVNLESLRVKVAHPPFDRADLEKPLPAPASPARPPEPALVLPTAPTGLASLFGKRKHAEAVAQAKQRHQQAVQAWRTECAEAEKRVQKAIELHARAEAQRLESLRRERERYAKECAAREQEAIKRNQHLDELIANLGYGTPEAIQEYVSIVLANSAYPDHFPVEHEFTYDLAMAELDLRVLVPKPAAVPTVKSYKYNKSNDEFATSMLSQKECKERYANAICQVALRSFHEVFESDRRGLIRTIALEVGANTIDPATGRPTYVPFVIAAAERESFLEFDLSAVVPALTLERLGAAISKNPYGLAPAQRAGVRKS